MKRDIELVRTILLSVEASDNDPRGWINLEIPGYSKTDVAYHVSLLGEAGLLEVQNLCSMGNDGYDFRPKTDVGGS